ncbi:MAG: Fe-S cluster assembly ATPase SufC [Thermoprotei archaeon]|jgi:Fe-S cluster assembly ATP-binding protein
MALLEIKNLRVLVEGKEILKGINLTINQGEVHAVMGPNGSGKSTLAYSIMGHPKYKITEGDILFNGQSILQFTTDQRARLGLFLAFQTPLEIQGLPLTGFLRTAHNMMITQSGGVQVSPMEFMKIIREKIAMLNLDESFVKRYLNEGFSGGERKKNEVLQMLILKPKLAILDEVDTGLDIDSLKIIAQAINSLRDGNRSILMITHYQRILKYVKPDHVHVILNGKIVLSGDYKLAEELEARGYGWLTQQFLTN